ncbi:MAG: metallophosphoesterase [Gammaproteobacteria bacterium]|nr:MAG: metallophosphoesterase [Gammaproteobacteria bacterium]
MNFPTKKSSKGFLHRFRDLVDEFGACEDIEIAGSVSLGETKVRFSCPLAPILMQLGGEQGKRLQLYPEPILTAEGGMAPTGAYLIEDPEYSVGQLQGFLRLVPGDTLVLGREEPQQRDLLDYPGTVAERHLRIKLGQDGLTLKNLALSEGSCLSPLPPKAGWKSSAELRLAKLEHLARRLGAPILEPPAEDALALIEGVIAHIAGDPHQPRDAKGRPGGLVELPPDVDPVFVGDLHARIDNLLVVLTQNAILDGLEAGRVALIIVGDAPHPDEEGQEAEMDTSLLLMDLIFRLQLAFPGQVYYLRGNHDSFSEEISKNGVPQGVLWEHALRERRGSAYFDAMSQLYRCLPYVATSPRFVACHAGPPTSSVSRAQLIDMRDNPRLEWEVTRVRLRKPNSPAGYGPGDVKRLRKALDLGPYVPLMVGHTPLSGDDTLWVEAGNIPSHHVIFGAHPEWIGIIAIVGERFMPLRYPVEPLTGLYNRHFSG